MNEFFIFVVVVVVVFFLSLLTSALCSGYDRGERCLSANFFAMFTCLHVQFSKIFVFLVFSMN